MIRAVVVFLLWAGMSQAQTPDAIRVLSGEHDGFTRLSLQIGARDWRIGRQDGGYGLQVTGGGAFRLDGVFDVLTRRRLADLHEEDGTLALTLACNCHLRSFRHAADWLVIDIRDGAPDPESPFERPLAPEPIPPLPLILRPPSAPLPDDLAIPRLITPTALTFRANLQRQITAAADEGEVDLTHGVPAPLPEVSQDRGAPAIRAGQIGVTLHQPPLPAAGLPQAALPDTICAEDAAFALKDWASGDFSADIAAALAIWGASGTEQDAALALTKTYLAYGFGAEAAQVLALHPMPEGAAAYLPALAALVDGRPVAQFATQESCVGAVTLWAALAKGDLRYLTSAQMAAVINSIRLLPTAVRASLSPRLAGMFQEIGDDQTAAMLLHPESQEQLPRDGDALLAALRQRLAQGDIITPPDLHLVQSLRYEARGTVQEPALQLLEVQVLGALGLYRQAIATAEALPADKRDGALLMATTTFVEAAPDDAFLATAFDLTASLPDAAQHILAKRLIDGGFPEAALARLSAAATGAAMAERRYLRAEAAVVMGRADLVTAELLGLADPRAEALRAAAVATTADAPLYAWRRPDLAELRESSDPLLQQAAQTVDPPDPLSGAPPLALRQALIGQAQDARAFANALLSRFEGLP